MTEISPVHLCVAKVKQIVIQHPQYRAAYDAIADAYEMRKNVGVSQHLVCVGQSGTGKSTLKEMIRKAYPPIPLEDRELVPVLCVDTPSQPTIRNLAEAVLVQLDEPCFYRGSAIDKTNRILNLVKEKQVKLIILDELQHFIDRGKSKAPLEVSDWLKTVIDRSNASTVLMGLQRSEKILEVNEQLRRRYSRRIELKPFSCHGELNVSIFLGVIHHFEQLLELPHRIPFDGELIRRFHYATNGIIDYIVRLLIGAFELATSRKNPIVDINVLECAFTERIWNEGIGSFNPFSAKFVWSRLDQPGMPFNRFEEPDVQRSRIS